MMKKLPTGKARGCFFAAFEIFAYEPGGVVFGQYHADSCVAACCRMLLADFGLAVPETHLRALLAVEDGAFISAVPEVLEQCGAPPGYQYRNDLTLAVLHEALALGAAMVFVARPGSRIGHALLVDQISNELVAVRDPLPELEGKAYLIALRDFLPLWLRADGCGRAAIVKR